MEHAIITAESRAGKIYLSPLLVTKGTVCSKVGILFLFIHCCYFLLPLCVCGGGGMVVFGLCFVVWFLMSFLV